MDEFEKGFKEESIKNAVKTDILPKFTMPGIGEAKTVRFLKQPTLIKNPLLPKGEAWTVDVENNGMKMGMIIPDSLRFQLVVQKKKHGLTTLEGQSFVISAAEGESHGKKAKLYSASLV